MARTVSKQALINEAEALERSAKESLDAWIILGQTSKYQAHMEKAALLRKAANSQSVRDRREMLGSLSWM